MREKWKNITIRKVQQNGESLGFLIPDGIWSNNCFVKIVEALSEGKKAYFWAPLRASHETFSPIFEKAHRHSNQVIDISGRDLAKLGMQHLNGLTRGTIWGAENSTWHSGQLLWPIDKQKYIFRSFYCTPIVISRKANIVEIPIIEGQSALDDRIHSTFGDMHPTMCVTNTKDVAMPTDSDDFMHFEVSLNMKPKSPQKTVRDIVLWAERQAAINHISLFDAVFKFHADDGIYDDASLNGSEELVRAISAARKKLSLELLFSDRDLLKERAVYHYWREKHLPAIGQNRNFIDRLILNYFAKKLSKQHGMGR